LNVNAGYRQGRLGLLDVWAFGLLVGFLQMKNVAFASPYCLIDYSSGATIATGDCLELLASSGFRCHAYCPARLDFREEVCFEETLAELGLPYEVRKLTAGPHPMKLVFTRKGDVAVTIFRNQFTRIGPTPQEFRAFLAGYQRFLDTNKPDVVLTYGGDPLALAMIAESKRRGIPVVFGLHNFQYHDARVFRHVDYVVVPSEFSKQYYWDHLGLECQVLPYVIDFQRVKVDHPRPQYLTFVNPQPAKGVFLFARIAEQLARRRPDIPILVVESRDRTRALERTGVDLSWAKNLFGMANTTDPRQFYAVTKVLIMPSLWNESFGLVAAEAMINGIPVMASNRGALPEVVGDGGLLFDIPQRYTPRTTDVPTAEEVEPWVETIIRLWDDEVFYRQQSQKGLQRAQRWHPDRLRTLYVDFFRNIHPQPIPPIALSEEVSTR